MEKSKNKKVKRGESGFTLIEILVVIGLIALLAAVVIIAINPARQFAQGRNSQRVSNVNAILNAIGQRIADNKGMFRDSADTVCLVDLPSASSTAQVIAQSGGVDLRPCISPTYIPEIPVDPADGAVWDGTAYDTKYTVAQGANGRITICAPNAAAETAISAAEKPICVTR
jgi:type IV pilus assembly protein PilA